MEAGREFQFLEVPEMLLGLGSVDVEREFTLVHMSVVESFLIEKLSYDMASFIIFINILLFFTAISPLYLMHGSDT